METKLIDNDVIETSILFGAAAGIVFLMKKFFKKDNEKEKHENLKEKLEDLKERVKNLIIKINENS